MEKVNVVIDVEMCKVEKSYHWRKYPYASEIIQIGAVMMDSSYTIIDEFSAYVYPLYGKINYFIKSLTGITEKDVRKAQPLSSVLNSMLDWIGERDATFYSWSDTDYYQIRREINSKVFDKSLYSVLLEKDHWINYQEKAGLRFGSRNPMSLEHALCIADIYQEGRAHDGLDDAYNTAKLIQKLERNPESRFSLDLLNRTNEENSTQFGFSLGGMLSGLVLQTV